MVVVELLDNGQKECVNISCPFETSIKCSAESIIDSFNCGGKSDYGHAITKII